MFPLSGREFPGSGSELAAAIEKALAEVMTLPAGRSVVTVTGDAFPAISSIEVNLDGAAIRTGALPPKPVGVGDRRPGISVEQARLSGHPIRHQQARLELDVSGRGLKLDFDRDANGSPLLVLTAAESGDMRASISQADLQALALEGATLAAKQQGVAIQELQLSLASEGPRTLAAHVRVKAKKMMMSGVVHLRGRLAIDDRLNATVSQLSCAGEGMVGNAAAAMLQKKVQELEGRTIPLTALSLGEVALRDLQIQVAESVRVTASFGNR
jgi:hypothetical protein